uniref:F-box protein n=1 Tax=Noccaea caerulescens TaxID=107243 RepID=A0A1J3H2R8_NOCCA
MNPFDAVTMYLQSNMHTCLASTNLRHKGGKFGLHNNLERSSYGHTLSFDSPKREGSYSIYSTFVLPRWLYRIPSDPHQLAQG